MLGYLARTAALRVTYRRDADAAVRMAYIGGEHDGAEATAPYMATDADHGTGRSYTGWLVMLAAAAAGWGVRAQPQPSLSSTEAELYGLSTSVCELLIFANLLEEVGYSISHGIPVFCDSRGARLLVEDCAAPARTRHIHRRWYFVRYYKDAGAIVVREVKGVNNPANFMTKAVGGASFARDRAYVGLG